MCDKVTIAAALRGPDGKERARILATLPMDDIDHDIFKLIIKAAVEDPSSDARVAAIRQLSAFWPDPAVVKTFRAIAADTDIQVADAVAGSLSRAHDDTAKQLLFEAYLKAAHFGFKWLVFEALTTGWPYREIESIVTGYLLADSDEVVRASAVAYLGRQDDPALVDDLVDRLRDTDARVRANALEALSAHRHRVPREVFERMACDPHHRVQCIALSILHEFGVPTVDRRIADMVRSSNELFRASAVWVLRRHSSFPRRAEYLASLSGDGSAVVQRQLSMIHD